MHHSGRSEPFFDAGADPAINYGGIGGVIGHEMGHGFDDQGAKVDANGVQRNWWTAEDEKRFKARTAALGTQYDAFEPLPGMHVKGEMTMGENIGDLGGLTVAHEAYLLSLGGKEGGLTWHVTYSYVEATFQSTFEVSAESNSTADEDGNILVRPGNRIPLIPKHTGRLALDYDITPQWNVGGNVVATSGSYLHGDENNANQAGGTETLPGGAAELLDKLKGKITHVHLIDSDGSLNEHNTSTHNPFGTGHLNFDQLIPAIQAAGVPTNWWCVDLCFWPNAWDVTAQSKKYLDGLRAKYAA